LLFGRMNRREALVPVDWEGSGRIEHIESTAALSDEEGPFVCPIITARSTPCSKSRTSC
jgi:hypothetical protein